jgi:nucleotide-binding universal stress UspA family protein
MAEALKIVVPTDFSKESLAVLEWVKKLSNRGHVEVHCINVVQQYLPVTAGASMVSMPTTVELQHISQESLTAFVEKHMSDLDSPPLAKVLVGRPADEIANYAKEIGAEMIVIATRGHSKLAHVMLGSTAEGVVRHAECAVLTVRG